MIGTPWWATVLVGTRTVAGAGLAARTGAGRTREATRQREAAAAREEWSRRVQWAASLSLSGDERTEVAGLNILRALAESPLAGPAELDLLSALNDNTSLDGYRQHLDAGSPDADNEANKPHEGAVMTSAHDGSAVSPPSPAPPSPALIAAARLRVTINDRRGVPTEPEIRALAASGPGDWRT